MTSKRGSGIRFNQNHLPVSPTVFYSFSGECVDSRKICHMLTRLHVIFFNEFKVSNETYKYPPTYRLSSLNLPSLSNTHFSSQIV